MARTTIAERAALNHRRVKLQKTLEDLEDAAFRMLDIPTEQRIKHWGKVAANIRMDFLMMMRAQARQHRDMFSEQEINEALAIAIRAL